MWGSNKGCICSFAQWLHRKPLHSLLEVTCYSFFHILYLLLKARALQGLDIFLEQGIARRAPVPGDSACAFWDMVCEARAVLSAWGSAVVFLCPLSCGQHQLPGKGKHLPELTTGTFLWGNLGWGHILGYSLSQVFQNHWTWGPPGWFPESIWERYNRRGAGRECDLLTWLPNLFICKVCLCVPLP